MNSKENSTPAPFDARTALNLLDVADLLTEARQLNEAAFMACVSITDRQQQGALQQVLAMCGDIMRNVADNLDALQTEAREGGAA